MELDLFACVPVFHCGWTQYFLFLQTSFSGSSWAGILQGAGVSFPVTFSFCERDQNYSFSVFLFCLFDWRWQEARGRLCVCVRVVGNAHVARGELLPVSPFALFFTRTILWAACGRGYHASGGCRYS